MEHPFVALEPEYASLLATMKVQKPLIVDNVARKLIQPQYMDGYQKVAEATGVPAALIAALDQMESDANPHTAIGQGDPWNKVSTHVPRGKGPFPSKADADIFYVQYQHLDQVSAGGWSWPYVCWKAEAWNGFGYRDHKVHTPYLWAGTNLYKEGKFTSDGHWDAKARSDQIGVIPIMRRIVALRTDLAFDEKGAPPLSHVATPPANPLPAPVGVGGVVADHDTAWVQDALNKAYLMPGDRLKVDGSYGRRTREAVRSFQRFNKLDPDGLYGPQTDAALTAALQGVTT